MELEEMQAAWSQMSAELEQQKQLTNEIIIKMIKDKHTTRWGNYRRIEMIGGVVCYSAVIYLLVNFTQLDTLPLQICGALMIIFLILLPIFSLSTIKNMSNLDINGQSYIETMKDYVKKKKRFATFQKVNVVASFIFMLLTIPVSAKVFNNEDLFLNFDEKLLYAMPFCVLFFVLLVSAVARLNRKVLNNTEALLEEIKEVH